MNSSFLPETVFVSSDAKSDLLTVRVLKRLPKTTQVIETNESGDPLRSRAESSLKEGFARGKRTLILSRYRGDWLRACPGTRQHVCCNLWTVNPGEGCPLDCTYCYLQSYLARNPTLKLYTNTEDMLRAIERKVTAEPSRLFRIGTGEVIDSLVWDELTDASLELVPFFGRLSNGLLELKTKTDSVENLLKLSDVHSGNTVVSWSVNARSVTEKDEAFTATLDERIQAARAVIDAGYRVGIHFDPVIHFPGWEDEYREAVRDIFQELDPARVAWVSVSTLRYKRDMQSVMEERFPESKIPFGEQFLAKDGKLRYVQPLRFRLVNFVWNEIKAVSSELPVYMCMESAAAWKEIAGGPPVAGSELVEIFSRKGRQAKTESVVHS